MSIPCGENGRYLVDVAGKVVVCNSRAGKPVYGHIIRCSDSSCDRAAYTLDNFYPYHNEGNLCRAHLSVTGETK